jgi:hypothetical protein
MKMSMSYPLFDGPMDGEQIEIVSPLGISAPTRFYLHGALGDVLGFYQACQDGDPDSTECRQAYTWKELIRCPQCGCENDLGETRVHNCAACNHCWIA